MDDQDYTLIGCVEFIGTDTCFTMGYELKKEYPGHAVLAYSKQGSLDEGLLYYKKKGKMDYIPSHLILNRIALDTAIENYPELFL